MIRLFYIFIMCVMIRSIKTIQNISQNSGHKYLSAILIGIDTVFFLLVFQNVITNTITFSIIIVVAGGYISGYLIGAYVEEKIALGKVIVVIKIDKVNSNRLVKVLNENGFAFIVSKRYYSHKGKLKKIHSGILYRRELPILKNITKDFNFIATVEPVKSTFGKEILSNKELLRGREI